MLVVEFFFVKVLSCIFYTQVANINRKFSDYLNFDNCHSSSVLLKYVL